ncbi:hypothetical protein J6590_102708 [Homalodisca vitripennis]|nr:hypothetical protein J6590_102708 [Homalodisca vitripennis]
MDLTRKDKLCCRERLGVQGNTLRIAASNLFQPKGRIDTISGEAGSDNVFIVHTLHCTAFDIFQPKERGFYLRLLLSFMFRYIPSQEIFIVVPPSKPALIARGICDVFGTENIYQACLQLLVRNSVVLSAEQTFERHSDLDGYNLEELKTYCTVSSNSLSLLHIPTKRCNHVAESNKDEALILDIRTLDSATSYDKILAERQRSLLH